MFWRVPWKCSQNVGFGPIPLGGGGPVPYILIITGGLNVCHKIRRHLSELPPSESEWLQSLLRACDWNFVWDVTGGNKPRATSSNDIKGQNKIKIDTINIIGEERLGNAQNNDGILGEYILWYFYLSGRCRLHPLFLLFFSYFLSLKKNDFFFQQNILTKLHFVVGWTVDSRHIGSKEWSVEPHEPPWMASSKLWVTDAQGILTSSSW